MAVVKRTWQDRLAQKEQNLKRKFINENISRNGSATDAIYIKQETDRNGDVISTKILKADCIPVIFPVMKDVPVRFINREDGGYSITNLVASAGTNGPEEKSEYKINVGMDNRLEVGDLIIRVMLDQIAQKPIILVLQVTECLATFDINAPILLTYNTALYTGNLSQKVIDMICNIAKKRLYLNF